MVRRPWNPGRAPGAFPTRKSRRRGTASDNPDDHCFVVPASMPRDRPTPLVQAVPDQVTVLDTPASSTGRHDLHIVAIRRIRGGGFLGLLPSAVPNTSGPMAGFRESVLLRVWPAPASAASGRRRIRNLSFPDSGVAESPDMAAGRHRLQSRAAGVLQIQIPVY